MIGEELQDILNRLAVELDNKKEYANLCKEIWNYDVPKRIVKKEAEQIRNELQLDFEISGNEGLFYKDYFIGGIQIRFIIPYKYGMIDPFYRAFKGLSDNSFPTLTFREIVQQVRDVKSDPTFSFPIIGDIEDFKKVLTMLLEIDSTMISKLKNKLE
ncbi:MAG: hypothetical protein ACOYXT_26730 [Bacteroidota bacterium]